MPRFTRIERYKASIIADPGERKQKEKLLQKPPMRIGHGYDIHEFCAGAHVMLAGVKIPHYKGIKAHSDGDVILHALSDALLGAMSLGDIGKHFPDSDDSYKGMASLKIVEKVFDLVITGGYVIANVDITLLAQEPKVSAYIEQMKEKIAAGLKCHTSCVSVKATTTEGLGFVGREEGLGAHAVVLLTRV